MMKKLLSIILAIVMTLSVFSCVSVYAVEETTAPATENTTEGDVTEPPIDEPTTDEPQEPEVEYTKIPETPALKSGANVKEGVSVSWAAVEEAKEYNVYRRRAGEVETKLIATVEATSYVDPDVLNNTYYKYTISAVNPLGESAPNEGRLIKFVSTPELLSFKNTVNGYELKWSAIEGAAKYRVYKYHSYYKNWAYVGEVKGTTYNIVLGGLKHDGEVHTYTVRADNVYYSGFDADGISVVAVNTPRLEYAANYPTGIQFEWSNTGAEGYRVYRRASGEKYWTYLETIKATKYFDKNVKHNVYYRYTVVGVTKGVFSAVDQTGVLIKRVDTPKVTGVANASNGIYVRWGTLAGVTNYSVYRRGAGETTWKCIATKATGNRIKDTTALVGNYYRYAVVPYGANIKCALDPNGPVIRFVPLNLNWGVDNINRYYDNAVKKAQGVGYTINTYQKINSHTCKGDNNAFVKEFKALMTDAFATASTPITETYAKGSREAYALLPTYGGKVNMIKSATVTKKGNNYVVKMVFKDMDSKPNIVDIDDVSVNSLGMDYVVDTFRSEGLISSGSVKSTYKSFTITAEITLDGKIVNMTHNCSNIVVDMDLKFVNGLGKVQYDANVGTFLTYKNFKY